jgi:hypothetical protein
MRGMLEALALDLKVRGKLEVREAFIGSFTPAKKGGRCGQNRAWQRNEDYGSGRPPWSSCRHIHGKCYAA